MSNLFNPDNKFFTFMGRVADLMILNILCIICCIPVITIGPAITAMFYVTLKMVRNEESYIAKSFFRSFKQNFRQSTIVWVVMLLAGILLVGVVSLTNLGDFTAPQNPEVVKALSDCAPTFAISDRLRPKPKSTTAYCSTFLEVKAMPAWVRSFFL